MKREQTEVEDFLIDKKIKLKEFNDQKVTSQSNAQQEVNDLEKELKGKDQELERLQKLLKERRDLLARTENMAQSSPDARPYAPANQNAAVLNTAADLRYEQLSTELQQIKMRLQDMNENQV